MHTFANVSLGDWTAVLLLFVGLVWIFLKNVQRYPAFALLAVLFYSSASKLISNTYLDFHSAFISESSTVSHSSASWIVFGICTAVMFAAAIAVTRFDRTPASKITLQRFGSMDWEGRNALLLIGLIVAAELGVMVVSQRFALPGTGINRYNFWRGTLFPQLETLLGTLWLMAPAACAAIIAGGARLGRETHIRAGLALGIAYFLLLALQGQRFHGFLYGATLIFTAYAFSRSVAGKPLFSRGMFWLVPLILVLGSVLFSDLGDRGIAKGGGALNAAAYRVFVLQGHTFWNAYSRWEAGYHAPLWALTDGLRYSMRALGSNELVRRYEYISVNFATSLPTMLVLIGGPALAILGSAIYGAAYGLVVVLFNRILRNGRALAAIPFAYLWQYVHTVYARGSIETILSPMFVIAFAGVFILLFASEFLERQIGVRSLQPARA